MNDPNRVKSAQDFQRVMHQIGFTFNWFYADDRDIAYFNSGNNPVRATGVDPDMPNWGTGQYDWQNYDVQWHKADYTPFEQHPQTINQSYLTSWNNKQARGYRAADDNYSFSSIHRSQPLDDRIDDGIRGGGKMSLEQLIDAMEDAGTVDLRADKVLPWMLRVIGEPSDPELAQAVDELHAWQQSGAHRIDRNRDGRYEHDRAIQIMDAWWPRAVDAQFRPALGSDVFTAARGMMGYDNEPNNHGQHLGSAYQSGWYGYVQKDLRRVLGRSVPGALSRKYCGDGDLSRCRSALLGSLQDALTVPRGSLYRDSGCDDGDQWCYDAVRFRAIGAITVPPIHWINRPTFQQAVEVQGHRPR
jgi:hypothetical protein